MATVVPISTGAQGSGAFPSSSMSRPIYASKYGASFHEVVQRGSTPSSLSLLVQESLPLVIPMDQDAEEEEEYYRSVSLVYRFNGFWPKLVDLNILVSYNEIGSLHVELVEVVIIFPF
jgi:hypothetical protein